MSDSGGSAAATMRILYVAEAFGGGLFEIVRIKAERLAELGHEVGIAYGMRPETPSDVRDRIDRGVELFPMPWKDRSIGAQLSAQWALRRLVRRWSPDVVHLMSSFAGFHGAVALGGTVPLVYTAQGYAFTMTSIPAWKRFGYLLLENFVARRVDVVAGCSLSEGEQARSLPGAHSVAVVENGIPELNPPLLPLASPGGSSQSRVIALGRPSPQRRPEACARIFAGVSDVAEVKWVGGGPTSAGTQALDAAGIPTTGWLSRDATLAELSKATIYLHWTGWDGLPLSILEAMAKDVIVVASDIGPNREVLGPEQAVRTERQATELIRALLTDPDLRKRVIESQRSRRQAYSAERMVNEWIRLYEELGDKAG